MRHKLTIALVLPSVFLCSLLLLVACQFYPITATEPQVILGSEQTDTVSQKLLSLGSSMVLTFTSGMTETGRQEISLQIDKPGTFKILLENDSQEWAGHWIIWDHISLRQGDEVIWSIGEDESPPDYTSQAYSELCNPLIQNCVFNFKIGDFDAWEYPREINDGKFPSQKISFALPEQYVNADLTLVLSTLYATHKDTDGLKVDGFKMKISLLE